MSNYVVTTDFTAKDALAPGHPSKVIKGTEFGTEFANLATHIATKADLASPTLTGTPAAPTAAADTSTTQIATTAFVVGQGYLKSATAASTYAPLSNPVFTTGSVKCSVTGGLWTYNYAGGGTSGILYMSEDGSRYLFNNAGTFTLSHALTVSGNVTASDFILSSDARKKENVEPITNALDIVQELRGVTFDYKETGKASVGFIAQEVRDVLPQLVHQDADGYLGVSYAQVVAVLAEAVKELRAEVAALKAAK